MKAHSHSTLAVLFLAATLTHGMAQEPPPPAEVEEVEDVTETSDDASSGEAVEGDGRLGRWMIEIGGWVAQPAGLDDHTVTLTDPANPLLTSLTSMPHGTETEMRYRLGYSFKNDIGDIMLTWWAHKDVSTLGTFQTGNFVLGELLVLPGFSGVFDDGTADAALASSTTATRDLRMSFSREALRTKRLSARWSIGFRNIDHSRNLSASYHALAPNLPPVQPPLAGTRDDLNPRADVGFVRSSFSGRGPEIGLDLSVPIRDRFLVEAGLAAAVLRGRVDSSYASQTQVYAVVSNGTIQQVLAPPFAEFEAIDSEGAPVVNSIQQVTVPMGLQVTSASSSAQVLEAHLGVRVRVWKQLELIAGLRDARYDNVALDLRPAGTTLQLVGKPVGSLPGRDVPVVNDVRIQGLVQTPRSVTYEGYYGGLAYRY